MRWFGRVGARAGEREGTERVGAPRLPFADRTAAGRLLAERLAAEGLPRDTIVLGIPRGGVGVAAEVAAALDLNLDVLVAHKVGAPANPEFAIGAVAADGTTLIEPWAQEEAWTGPDELERAAAAEVALARAREARLRPGRGPLEVGGRTVVVVDDGIATGATVEVAVAAAKRAGAARVVVASPVAAPTSAGRLRAVADDVVTLAEPPAFQAVGQFYVRFEQLDDQQVMALLQRGAHEPARPEAETGTHEGTGGRGGEGVQADGGSDDAPA